MGTRWRARLLWHFPCCGSAQALSESQCLVMMWTSFFVVCKGYDGVLVDSRTTAVANEGKERL